MSDPTLLADILEDMIATAGKIEERCGRVKTSDEFLEDEEGQILLDSICMLLIAVGEGVKQIDKLTNGDLLCRYPAVEWKRVAGIRDILSHHYFDLNAETIFGVCSKRIAVLKQTLEKIYQDTVSVERG